MNGLDALFYLEWRRAVNFVLSSRRQPARIIVWIMAIAWIGLTIVSRTHASGAAPHSVPEPLASLVGFAGVTILCVVGAVAANGYVGTFNGSADARFLVMSSIPEHTVVAWLQVRNAFLTLVRLAIGIIVYVIYFSRTHEGSALLAMIGATLIGTFLPLPAFELSHRLGRTPVRTFFWVLAAIGGATVAALAIGFVAPQFSAPSVTIEKLGLGSATVALWTGDSVAIANLYLTAVVIVAVGVVAGGDLYPELYAASQKWASRLRRGRGYAGVLRPKHGVESAISSSTVFSGVWIEVWKQRIFFARSPSVRALFFFEFAVSVGAGVIGGVLGRHDPLALGALLSTVTFIIVILLALSGTSVANDLSKPIWWFGQGSTFAKLAAWAWSTSLDTSVVLGSGALAAGITAHQPALAFVGIIGAALVPPLVRSIGVATYAFFPAAIDQRGPLAALRVFVIYFCFSPPVIAWIVIAYFTRNSTVASIAAAIVMAAESAGALAIAARRVEGRGAEYSVSEQV